MESAVSNDNESGSGNAMPAAVLRGTAKGLEIHVDSHAAIDAIVGAVSTRLAEAPGFFRGSDVRVRIDGPLPAGTLGKLDELALAYELRIVEVGAPPRPPVIAPPPEAIPEPQLAAGSAPAPATADLVADSAPDADSDSDSISVSESAPEVLDVSDVSELLPPTDRTRLVLGPVRSGVILEHPGHLIVFGDVNPGAEIRAEGNIVVLGRLRGTAHAGIGRDLAFIVALRLEPQQLRVGRKVARAADSDAPVAQTEIAYVKGETIVVEPYAGKLPANLATSI